MKPKFLQVVGLVLFSLYFVQCAKRGNPTGGPLDTIPPVVTKTTPENYSTNFDAEEIRVYFDEYIKLKNPGEQIIISPPLDNQPIITPLNASRYIQVSFLDTLQENTTYTINFGQSIVDNNEDNPYDFYKYVFSTGNEIDSLEVLGTVKDATLKNPEKGITVMLYEKNESYTDSVVYKQKPLYVASTIRNPKFFRLENIKAGRYLLVAIKDRNNNYKFDPKTDKIGFVESTVEVPTDTTYSLNLFKEIPAYRLSRPTLISNTQVLFGYEGKADSLQIELLTKTPANFEYHITKELTKDTVHYWFRPELETDSLQFLVKNASQVDTTSMRYKANPADSLRVKAVTTGNFTPDEVFEVTANLPLVDFQEEKIAVMDKDSAAVPFSVQLDKTHNLMEVSFSKEGNQRYIVSMFPEAVTDFYGATNDTLSFTVNTRPASEYGFLSLQVRNIRSYPVLVQLVTKEGKVVKELVSDNGSTFEFEHISPGEYYPRIIFDENANGKWDTGDFLKRKQPEEVVFFPELLEVRANWTLNETFILE